MTYGPVDFIALEFTTHKLKGEVLPELLDLVKSKTIRIVDLVIIRKDELGDYEAFELKQAEEELVAILDPLDITVTGIIQVEDIEAIADTMENDTTAALLLVENLWAIRFKEAVMRADGRLISQERIPIEVLEETMAAFALDES